MTSPELYPKSVRQPQQEAQWFLSEDIRLEGTLTQLRYVLPGLAASLIATNQDMRDPSNHLFLEYPDNPEAHARNWHQYGILTHSERFREVLARKIPDIVRSWGIFEPVTASMSQTIDGIPRANLLQIAGLLHDVGKFSARKIVCHEGEVSYRFTGHEAHSGQIVRYSLGGLLQNEGFTATQIEYIARCAELHFELGKVRRTAEKSATGYNLAFAASPACKDALQKIINEHPSLALEIGLMFIADNLSKTELFFTANTDEEISKQEEVLTQQLAVRGLDLRLIRQAMGQPVNMAVAEQYLRLWARQQAPVYRP